MKTGRISDIIYKRSVTDRLLRQRAGFRGNNVSGDEASRIPFEMFSGCFQGHYHDAGERAVVYAANKAFAHKMKPVGITLNLTVPERISEKKVSDLVARADMVCHDTNGIFLDKVNVYVDDDLNSPNRIIADAVCLAIPFDRKTIETQHLGPKAGFDIVMTGYAAMDEASDIALRRREELVTRLPEYIVDRVKNGVKELSTEPSVRAVSEYSEHFEKPVFTHAASEGGILTALWDVGEKYDLGITADGRSVLMLQEIVEVCEFFDIDPYRMDSNGCLLTAVEDGEPLCEYFWERGIDACVIGSFTDSNDRVILMDEEYRYLEPFRGSEKHI